MSKPDISVVIPVFNEQEALEALFGRLKKVIDANDNSFEILFVNDGSTDSSEKILTDFHNERPEEVRVINFNTNFGQHMAIMAGFERVRGSIVVTMDADLQNWPEDIPLLINEIQNGHDIASGWRKDRKDRIWRKALSSIHNRLMSKIIPGIQMKDEGCMLRAYRRSIVDAVASGGESNTFINALALTYSSNPTEVPVRHSARKEGSSSYGLFSLIRYNFDLVTNFSLVPLQLVTLLGMVVSLGSMGLASYMVYRRLTIGPEAEGIFTLFTILFMLVGICLFSLGILGEYIGRMYKEVLRRPRFIIKNTVESQYKVPREDRE